MLLHGCEIVPESEIKGTYLPLFLANPKLVESPKTTQNTATQPTTILSLDRISRCVDLHLEGWVSIVRMGNEWTRVRECSYQLGSKTISEPVEHAAAPSENDIRH